jgi:hypothetical protein
MISWARFLDYTGFFFITIRLLFCTKCCSPARPSSTLDHNEIERRKLKAEDILCPVLATLYKQGLLHPNSAGRVYWDDLSMALQEHLGVLPSWALFHSVSYAAFKEHDVHQSARSRFGKKRCLNLFKMNVGQVERPEYLKHGFSTTIRDSRYDPAVEELGDEKEPEEEANASTATTTTTTTTTTPITTTITTAIETKTLPPNQNFKARQKESRRQRFERWFTRRVFFLQEDRCYLSGLARVIKDARESGCQAGEFSEPNMTVFHPTCCESKHRKELFEYQACLKLASLFVCFGTVDEGSGRLYMSRLDLEAIYLESCFPVGWKKTPQWGFESSLRALSKMSESGLLFAKAVDMEIMNTLPAAQRKQQLQVETGYSDFAMMLRFIKLLKKRGFHFFQEDETIDSTTLNTGTNHGSQQCSDAMEKGDTTFPDMDDVDFVDEGGRLSLGSLSSLVSLDSSGGEGEGEDDDTIPLIR